MNLELRHILGEVFLFVLFVTSWTRARSLRRRLARADRWRAAYSVAVEKLSFLIEQSPDEHLRIAADRITDEMIEQGCNKKEEPKMATDGPTPVSCDREIFERGEQVFMTDIIPSNAMERWVKAVATLSGQRVDWHFACGRACVLALGDLKAVRDAIEYLLPVHDSLREDAIRQIEDEAGMGRGSIPRGRP